MMIALPKTSDIFKQPSLEHVNSQGVQWQITSCSMYLGLQPKYRKLLYSAMH